MKKLTALLLTVIMLFSTLSSAVAAILPASLTVIEDEAFMGDTALTTLTVPDHVTSIGAKAFKDSGLTEVLLPDSLLTIGTQAFANTGLTSISLPSSITSIGDNAFEGLTITVTAAPGSYAFNWCLDHQQDADQHITLALVEPSAVTLSDRGQVSISVADPREHTVMLGVYHRSAAAAKLPRLIASAGVSDTPNSATQLAVIPVTIPANSTSVTTDIIAFFQDSGSYYVKAAASASSNASAADLSTAVTSNVVSYTRPETSLDRPENAKWSQTNYGRATWDAVPGAVSYQVTLYSNDGIVAHRNVNTNHFTFSSGWLDLEHIQENGYYFKVVALSSDIFAVSNSPESYGSGTLVAPKSTDLVIATQPASRYASLNESYSVSLSATGVGVTYDWYQVTAGGDVRLAANSDDNVITLNADTVGTTEVYAVLTDAYGRTLTSEHALIQVIDDSPLQGSVISQQPLDYQASTEASISFSISVDLPVSYSADCAVTYDWYSSLDGSSFRTVTDYTGPYYRTLVRMYSGETYDGLQAYCVVTVKAPTGKVIATEQSRTATLTVEEIPLFFSRDLISEYYAAKTRTIYVETEAKSSVSYQWLYQKTGSTSWQVFSGANSAYFPANRLTEEQDGAWIKCVASTTYQGQNYRVESSAARVYLAPMPATAIDIYAASSVDTTNLVINEDFYVKASLLPSTSTSSVYWFSTDESVATINSEGKVKIKSMGTATIIGSTSPNVTIENGVATTSDGVTDTLPLTVNRIVVRYMPHGGQFSNGSTASRTYSYLSGETIDLPMLSKAGDTFLGWMLDGEIITSYTASDRNITLNAQWESTTEEEDKTLAIEQDLGDRQYAPIGDYALFEVVTNGAKVTSYQWYVNAGDGWETINGGSFEGVKASLKVDAEEEASGNQYRVVIAGANGDTVTSNTCTLITGESIEEPVVDPDVPADIHFTMQPEDLLVKRWETARFYVGVTTAATYQWEVLASGSTVWTALDGETGTVLTIPNASRDLAGNQYRCVVTAGETVLTSNAATLDVIIIIITPSSDISALVAGDSVTLSVSSTHGNEDYSNVTWNSLNPSIVAVDEEDPGETCNFLVKDTGTATITATIEGVTQEYELTVNHVMLQLQANEGSFDGAASRTEKSALGDYVPTAPTRDGYLFLGWSEDSSATTGSATVNVTGPVTLYAVWLKNEIHVTSVTLETDDDTDALAVGDTLSFRAVVLPENADNKTVTWSSGNENVATVDSNGQVTILGTGNVMIYAKADGITGLYQLNISRVRLPFYANGGQYADESAEKIYKVAVGTHNIYDLADELSLTQPTREGYRFVGWSLTADGTAVENVSVAVGTELYAIWYKPATSVRITVVSAPENAPNEIAIGDTITLSATVEPADADDTVEWMTDNPGAATVENGVVTVRGLGSVIITARAGFVTANYGFDVNYVTLTLYANGGAYDDEATVKTAKVNATVEIGPGENFGYDLVRDGYDFIGWSEDPDGSPILEFELTGDTTLYAVWHKQPVNATSVELTLSDGASVEALDTNDLVAGDTVTFAANIQPADAEGNVTWTCEPASVASIENGVVTIHGAGEAVITVTIGNVSDSYTLTINHVMVTLDGHGGAFGEETVLQEKAALGEYTPQNIPTKDGFTLLGWSEDSEATEGDTTITISAPVTLYAVWRSNYIHASSVTLTLADGSPISELDDNELIADETVALAASVLPANANDSVSWTCEPADVATIENGVVTIHGTGTATITATAGSVSDSYTLTINHVMVTLNGNGGVFGEETSIQRKAALGEFTPQDTPTKEEFTFIGWSENSGASEGSMSVTITAPVTLYAVWQGNTVHATSVTLSLVDGSPMSDLNNNELVAGETVTLAAAVLPENATEAVAWTCEPAEVATVNNGVVTIHGTGTATITATAGSVSDSYALTINHVMLTLNGNGGVFGEETSLTQKVALGESTLTAPTREGFTFIGWNEDPDATTGTLTINVTAPATLYAIWEAEQSSPTLVISGTDGNVIENQRVILTPQLYDADGTVISNATYTWYNATTGQRIQLTPEVPYWIDLLEGQYTFVATNTWNGSTIVCVGQSGNITAEASITLAVAEDTDPVAPGLSATTGDNIVGSVQSAYISIYCNTDLDDIDEDNYKWEYSRYEGEWQELAVAYGRTADVYVDEAMIDFVSTNLQFRCTVLVEKNGKAFEYISDVVDFYVDYDPTGGDMECDCGCGMLGCMCDQGCPMMGGGDPGWDPGMEEPVEPKIKTRNL